jgi:O-antigen/teichoic acid export membrane protein
MLHRLFSLVHNKDSLWWKSVFVTGFRGLAVLALFVVDAGLGRMLGTSGFGIYSNAVSTIAILMVIALFGLENMLIREVAVSVETGSTTSTKQLVRWGVRTTTFLSVLISFLFIIFIVVFKPYENEVMKNTILVGLLLLPMLVLANVSGIILRGFHKILTGQLVQYIIQPMILLVFVGYYYFYVGEISPVVAMVISAAGWFVAMVVAVVLLKRNISSETDYSKERINTRVLWTTSLVFAVIAGVQMTNSRVDIIMLYWFKGDSISGIYAATVRICDLLVFTIIAINISIGPTLARLHKLGEFTKIQLLITRAARISTLVTLPLLILVPIFSQTIMGLFGDGFAGTPVPLVLLCVSQAIVVLTGSKALLLVMSGKEHATAAVLGVTAIIHITCSLILIPNYGIIGAATSTALAVICWSVWLSVISIRQLGIDPTVFGLFKKQSRIHRH